MRLTDLLDNLVPLPGDITALTISGLAVNSAKVKQGDLFNGWPEDGPPSPGVTITLKEGE